MSSSRAVLKVGGIRDRGRKGAGGDYQQGLRSPYPWACLRLLPSFFNPKPAGPRFSISQLLPDLSDLTKLLLSTMAVFTGLTLPVLLKGLFGKSSRLVDREK